MKQLRQEYIGLEVEILETKNNTLKGLKGKIIDETKNTFKIKTNNQIKIILKNSSTFKINNENIEGTKITKKPHERIKIRK